MYLLIYVSSFFYKYVEINAITIQTLKDCNVIKIFPCALSHLHSYFDPPQFSHAVTYYVSVLHTITPLGTLIGRKLIIRP